MGVFRNMAKSGHVCSVPGCHTRGSFIISKTMGRKPLYLCAACIAFIAEQNAQVNPPGVLEAAEDEIPDFNPGATADGVGASDVSNATCSIGDDECLQGVIPEYGLSNSREDLDKLLTAVGINPTNCRRKEDCIKALDEHYCVGDGE